MHHLTKPILAICFGVDGLPAYDQIRGCLAQQKDDDRRQYHLRCHDAESGVSRQVSVRFEEVGEDGEILKDESGPSIKRAA